MLVVVVFLNNMKTKIEQASADVKVITEEFCADDKREEASKIILCARPQLDKDIVDTSAEIQIILKNAKRLPILGIILGKYFLLKKLTVSGRKKYGEFIVNLRNKNPDIEIKSDQTIRRYQLAFVRGCVRLGILADDKPSSLWKNVSIILAVTEEQIKEMFGNKTSIQELINFGKKSGKDYSAGGGADSTGSAKETTVTEPGVDDAQLEATIDKLVMQIGMRKKPLTGEQIQKIAVCLTKKRR